MVQQTGQIVVQATELRKDFAMGDDTVQALRGVDLTVAQGEFVAIAGHSGSGKSTLLGILGGLDTPTAGQIAIGGVDITSMSENQLAEIRNSKIGFVFQFFNLIPTLTALENVELPVLFSSAPKYAPRQRAKELLALVGLEDRMQHRPVQLSGGQQQRVAIARALANAPDLILADEPTGNLDSTIGQAVLQTLLDLRRETGTTLIVVTHDSDIAGLADRHLTMKDGLFVQDTAGC